MVSNKVSPLRESTGSPESIPPSVMVHSATINLTSARSHQMKPKPWPCQKCNIEIRKGLLITSGIELLIYVISALAITMYVFAVPRGDRGGVGLSEAAVFSSGILTSSTLVVATYADLKVPCGLGYVAGWFTFIIIMVANGLYAYTTGTIAQRVILGFLIVIILCLRIYVGCILFYFMKEPPQLPPELMNPIVDYSSAHFNIITPILKTNQRKPITPGRPQPKPSGSPEPDSDSVSVSKNKPKSKSKRPVERKTETKNSKNVELVTQLT